MEFLIQTNKREELINITEEIQNKISESENKILHIFIPHATCGITINESADPNLPKDITNFLNKLVPSGKWMHDRIDNNADAHIKTSLIGNSISVPVKKGRIQLGTWQNIFLCEFDGPRKRKIILNFT